MLSLLVVMSTLAVKLLNYKLTNLNPVNFKKPGQSAPGFLILEAIYKPIRFIPFHSITDTSPCTPAPLHPCSIAAYLYQN